MTLRMALGQMTLRKDVDLDDDGSDPLEAVDLDDDDLDLREVEDLDDDNLDPREVEDLDEGAENLLN